MTQEIKAVGYIIQDRQGNSIFGVGETVDEAWAQVIKAVGSFFDAGGNDIDPDIAYEAQFKTYGATASLLAEVEAKGGDIAWGMVKGVACTVAEYETALEAR